MNRYRRNNSKVRELKSPSKPNIGLVVFIFILIYILSYVVVYFTKEHVAIYEVVEKNLSDNSSFTGIAIRNETAVKAKEAGNITYYISSGTRVAVNDLVFSINEGGGVYDAIESTTDENQLTDDNYLEINDDLRYFKKKYSDSKFNLSYEFKNELENTLFEMNTGIINQDLETLISNVGEDNLVINKCNKSGIVSFTVDDMTNIKKDDLTSKDFDKSSYSYSANSTGKLLEKDSIAYKIITDERWSIIIKLTEEQYNNIGDKTKIGINFVKNNFDTIANIKTYVKDGDYYAELSLDGYMINYIDDRYIDVELKLNTASGLKIPNTSIIEKEFFLVPDECVTKGGNSDNDGLIVKKYNEETGEETQFVSTDIYYSKDGNSYIGDEEFELGTVIINPKTNEEYTITSKDKLNGVYCVNKGYCEFRRIDVIYSNSEYSIVKKGSEEDFMLSAYDHIVLDASVAIEDELIY